MPVPRIDRRLLAVCTALMAPALPAAPAAAAVVVGQDLALGAQASDGGAGPCPGGADHCTVALLRDAQGAPAAVPADGVLTEARVRAAAGADQEVRVRVLRPEAGGTFRPVATSPVVTLDGSGDVQGLAVALPVRAGDVLALRGASLPGTFAPSSGDGAHTVHGEPPAWPVGDAPRAPDEGATVPGDLLLAAVLEPDDDGDGAGDETQDACPADPARSGACAIDLVTVASAPAFEVGGRPVTQTFLVRNRGSSPADAVVLDLEAVQGADLASVSAPGACVAVPGLVLRCDLGRLAPGSAATVSATVVGPPGAIARTQVRASGRGVDLVPGDEADGAQTLLTGPSVAPAPRPFAAPPCVNGQTGNGDDEVLSGTSFGDRLIGRAGRDLLRGLAGDDCLEGGPGGDVLDGGDGADRLAGAGGNDRMQGGPGADTLRGGLGRDVLVGGPGGDQLFGGPGRDRLEAGDGNDTVDARDRVPETVDCGRGSDVARVDRRDRVRACERVSRG